MLTRWKVTRAAFGAVSKLLELQLRGDGDEGDDDGSAQADDGVFYQQIGVAVRPVVARTLRALGYEDGDEVVALKLWHKDSTKSPTDLAEGETRVYAAGAVGVFLKLLTSQAVLEAATVLLGSGASKGVNREGDAIRPGALSITPGPAQPNTPAPGLTTVPVVVNYTPYGGAPQTGTLVFVGTALAITGSASFTLGGVTGAGSSTVRAKD